MDCHMSRDFARLISRHPALRPPLLSMLNFNKSYTQFSWAFKQVRWFQDWFLIWIGLAAYHIALNEDPS